MGRKRKRNEEAGDRRVAKVSASPRAFIVLSFSLFDSDIANLGIFYFK